MMNDDFVTRVTKTITELKHHIADLEDIISDAEESRAKTRAQLALYEQSLAIYKRVMELPRTPEEQLPLVGGLAGTIADMAAQVMEAKGGSATVRELVDILTAAGKFKSPDKERLNYGTVFGTLQRDERFGKVPRKGEFYLVKDRHPESALRSP